MDVTLVIVKYSALAQFRCSANVNSVAAASTSAP